MTSYLSLQGAATLLKSFEMALDVKNTLEELLANNSQQEYRADTYTTPSMEMFLKSLNDKGEYFCNRCADMVTNYMDFDDVMSNQVERERERYHSSVPPPVAKVSLQLSRIKGFNYVPVVNHKRGTVPGSGLTTPARPEIVHVPLPTVKLEEKYSIFADEKFNKLCELLEKGLIPSVEEPPVKVSVPMVVEMVTPLPSIPATPSPGKMLEESILGDKILELARQLEDSRADVQDQQSAIRLLCQTNKQLKSDISELRSALHTAQRLKKDLSLAHVISGLTTGRD